MAFIRRPNYWLCCAAFVAAFWITMRVMAAPAAAVRPNPMTAAGVVPDPVTGEGEETRDPVLERMIGRFAREAREGRLRQAGR